MPTLIVHELREPPRYATLDQDLVTVGRAPDSDVVLGSKLVSRHHALIHGVGEGHWLVESLQADNLVVLNGELVIEPTEVGEGDELQIANYFVIFSLSSGSRHRYMSVRETRAGRCLTCGWEGEIPAVSHEPRCPACGKPIRSRTDDLTSVAAGGLPQQGPTAHLGQERVKRLQRLIHAARRASLERVTEDFGMPRRHDLQEMEACELGKEGRSPMPVVGLLLGRPPEVFWRADAYWIRRGASSRARG